MPNLSVAVWTWTGSPVVGNSVSVLHCAQGDEVTLTAAVNTFFNSIKTALPVSLVISQPTAGTVIDEASGDVVDAWSVGTTTSVTGTGAFPFPNGVGARVVFPTIGIVNGRHVRGSLFLVPLVNPAFEGAGNIEPATLAVLRGAALTLGTTPNAVRVYSRKTSAHAGISYPALTGTVPDKVSWLRSRRT